MILNNEWKRIRTKAKEMMKKIDNGEEIIMTKGGKVMEIRHKGKWVVAEDITNGRIGYKGKGHRLIVTLIKFGYKFKE